MKNYSKFEKEAIKNDWVKIGEAKANSFIIDRHENWLDRKEQKDYLCEIWKNGKVRIFKETEV
jgi:hypothetical protein